MARLKGKLRKVPTAYAIGAFGLIVTAYWAIQNINDPLRLAAILLLAAIVWGLFSTGWTIYETWSELRASRRRQPADKILARIAAANVRREVVRVVELLAFLWIAVSILLNLTNALVNRLLLTLIAMLIVANGVLDRIERDQTAADLAESLSQPTAG